MSEFVVRTCGAPDASDFEGLPIRLGSNTGLLPSFDFTGLPLGIEVGFFIQLLGVYIRERLSPPDE